MFFRRKQKAEDPIQPEEAAKETVPEADDKTDTPENTETESKDSPTSEQAKAEQPDTKKEKPAKKRYRVLRGFAYWMTTISIWVVIILLFGTVYFVMTLPDANIAGLERSDANITILAEDGTRIADKGERRKPIPLREIPEHMVNAVLAIEDSRFYSHYGIDPIGIIRAWWTNYRAGKYIQGGSTITQQLAKNLYLTPDRTYKRKIHEAFSALSLEMNHTKDKILELYLNRVYFGAGAYGIEAAAHNYFSKQAKDLTLAEAALLAGLLKAPSRYNPSQRLKISRRRTRLVLKRMVELKLVERRRASRAMVNPAKIRRPPINNKYSYIAGLVGERVKGYIGDNYQNLIVETTIDRRLQTVVLRSISRVMNREGRRRRAGQSAAIVFDHQGAIKAMTGAHPRKTDQFNRAVYAFRQPGSAFKPFIYLAALETGMTPDSIVEDRPVRIANWTPENYGGRYRGRITMKQALASSVNTVAVRLFFHAGKDQVIKTARRLGIKSEIPDHRTLALGTAGVSLMELTAAYVPFANGGVGILPHIITRIKTLDGKVLYTRRGHGPGQIIEEQHVRDMNRMLHAVVTNGTGKRAWFPGQPMAGKTGTSQNFRDAWFLGFTPYYTMGVWIGNDDDSYMRSVTGGSIPAIIWKDAMQKAHQGLTTGSLPGINN